MSYRPITPIKSSGIAVVTELYHEQEDARHSQVAAEDKIRTADPTRGRFVGRVVGGILLAVVLVGVVAAVAWPRPAPGPTPAAVTALATLAGSSPATTTFDGKQYTIVFTLDDPQTVYAAARSFAEQHGYSFDTPPNGRVVFDMSGPEGGVAVGYFENAGDPNTAIRIVIDASDLTVDGSALR